MNINKKGFYLKVNSEGLGVSLYDYCLAISWQPWNKFGFAYLSGKGGFGWSQHIGWRSWRVVR